MGGKSGTPFRNTEQYSGVLYYYDIDDSLLLILIRSKAHRCPMGDSIL